MRRRQSGLKRVGANLKRKATKSRNELAYILMWGEEVPKGRKTLKRSYR